MQLAQAAMHDFGINQPIGYNTRHMPAGGQHGLRHYPHQAQLAAAVHHAATVFHQQPRHAARGFSVLRVIPGCRTAEHTDCIHYCFKSNTYVDTMPRSNATPQPTPKPLVSVATAPKPPLQLCADKST